MDQDAISTERADLLMQLVGRCLLSYQRIEHALKIMLPHVAKPGMARPADPPNWPEFLDSKGTLGLLMGRFKEGLISERPDAARSYFDTLVGERNDLVHHFFTSSDVLSGSTEALERGISELERRLTNSLPLERSLMELVRDFAGRLENRNDS
jgi:hypothetical protein